MVITRSAPARPRHSPSPAQPKPPPSPAPPSWSETLPIVVLIGLVQASVFLPGSLSRPIYFWISTGLLLSLPLLFWNRYPRSILAPAMIYIASVCCLNIASNVDSGLGLLLLLPIVGVALLGSRLQSAITIAAVVIGSIVISLDTHLSFTATGRRAAVYFGMSLVISLAIITLREPLVRSRERAKLLLKDAKAFNDMARRLAVFTSPASIKRTAAELAATVGSPPESAWCRGAFLGIAEGRISVDSQFDQFEQLDQFDDTDSSIDVGWPSPDDPIVQQAIQSGTVASGLVTEGTGRVDIEDHQDTYSTWVPIAPDGQLQGLLGVASRGAPVPDTSVDQLVSLGHLVELALSNWSAHEGLEEMATREDRRRIARELHDGLAHELAYITSKSTSSSLAQGSPEAIQQLADAADRALDEARRAIVVLSEVHEDLDVSISQTVEDLAARHGLIARLDLSKDIVLAGDVTENLLRIVREAITNAARHSDPSTVTVTLAQDSDGVRLRITDDGGGFDDNGCRPTRGFGLTFMEERCALIGGSLDVRSRPGNGTSIEVRLPR